MDLTKQALFRLMNSRMDYLGQRQKVLAQNIANADTPNYKARDMRHVDFIQALHREMHVLAPTQTQAGHLPPVSSPGTFSVDKQKNPYETSLDKNGVVLEEQMLKVGQTQGDYATTTTLYRKYIDLLKTAIKS
jgi:flagellar basal-body rod protein FlgB